MKTSIPPIFAQGGYAGNALGFKVNSLSKLNKMRANKPRFALLHKTIDLFV